MSAPDDPMTGSTREPFDPESDDRPARATQWFLRTHSEGARVEDLPEFKRWIDDDPRNAVAYRQVAETWADIGSHATAPEIMAGRRNALDDARRAAHRRWSVRGWSTPLARAAGIAIMLIGAALFFYWQHGVYTTGIGEQRALRLDDGSLVTLDAKSRVRVAYSDSARLLKLERGRARFEVARDPLRPFRVQAGDQWIVAHGTEFNVERVAGTVLVTLLEGRVAVTGIEAGPRHAIAQIAGESAPATATTAAASPQGIIELTAGQGLHVRANGSATLLPKIDVERATAWQSGKLFFDNEPLASAVERVNRYSKLQIEVSPAVADVRVSGVFKAGDGEAFIEAVAAYFPVQVERSGASAIYLAAQQ